MKKPVKSALRGKFLSMLIFSLMLTACKKEAPSIITLAVTNITHESATTGGNVTDEGDGTVVSRGIVWGENDPSLESNKGFISQGTGTGLFSCDITDLIQYKEYIVKSFASSEYGTTYGNLQNFKTLANLAAVETTTPYDITLNSAKTGGVISDAGGVEVTERGIYWGTNINPEITGTKVAAGAGTGSFTVTLTDIMPETTYYVKAYAVNLRGESLGNLTSLTTVRSLTSGLIIYNPGLTYGSLTDIEGNTYKTIVIGTQTWMADNLRTTKYNDGSSITNVTGNNTWVTLTTPAFSWYDNNIAYKNYTGALYNWFVVETGKICPAGWHVPSDNEWTILTNFLGGESVAGGKIKETGLSHWNSPNEGATNFSGFTSVPGGQRYDSDGSFNGLFGHDIWWSSSEYNILKPYYRNVASFNTIVFRGFGSLKTKGFSIRCIKN